MRSIIITSVNILFLTFVGCFAGQPGNVSRGRISDTVDLPSSLPNQEYPFLVSMPLAVEEQKFRMDRASLAKGWTWLQKATEPKGPLPFLGATRLFHDGGGRLWFQTWEGNIAKYDGEIWTVWKYESLRAGFAKTAMWCDNDGRLFLGTASYTIECNGQGAQGVCALKDNVVERIFYPPLLSSSEVMKPLERPAYVRDVYALVGQESPDILWVGVQDRLFRLALEENVWTCYHCKNSPIRGSIRVIAPFEDQSVRCVCIYEVNSKLNVEIVRIEKERCIVEPTPQKLIHSLSCSRWKAMSNATGSIWLATADSIWKSGLKKTGKVAEIPMENGKRVEVTSILVDANSNLWVGTQPFGIWKYGGNSWTKIIPTVGTNVHPREVTDLAQDSLGCIWAAHASEGISVYCQQETRSE